MTMALSASSAASPRSSSSSTYRSASPSGSSDLSSTFSDREPISDADYSDIEDSRSRSNSVSTLINPPSSPTSPTAPTASASTTATRLKLVFSRNSVTRATLYAGAAPLFRVRTNADGSRTELCDLAPCASAQGGIEGNRERLVATIKRREVLPAVVVFEHRSGRAVRVSRWLREAKVRGEMENERYTLGTLFGEYIWKSDNRYRLALYSPDLPNGPPIAYHKKIDEPPTIALVLQSGFEAIRVEVITSFLELEHRLRAKDKIKEGERVFSSKGVYFVAGY